MARTTVAFIQQGLAFVHAALRDARNGTVDQLHFVPPNGSHSIAWCLWHTARVEDLIINRLVRGGAVLWNAEWAARTGLPDEGFGTGMADADAQQIRVRDMDAFAAYQDAVWAATEKFLEEADDDALAREIPARSGTETVSEAIMLHLIGHFNGHRGEINTLRGMQGLPTVMAAQGTH